MTILSVFIGFLVTMVVLSIYELKEEEFIKERLHPASRREKPSRFVSPPVLISIAILIFVLLICYRDSMQVGQAGMFVLLCAGLAWIRHHGKLLKRKNTILLQVPDFLDLLGLALSSGYSLDGAWKLALLYLPNGDLKEKLDLVQKSSLVGKSREDSFRSLIKSLGEERLNMIFALVIQSAHRGTQLQSVLHIQADMLRSARMEMMEKKAQTSGLRLLFPLMVFILPTLFLILFGPLLIRGWKGEWYLF